MNQTQNSPIFSLDITFKDPLQNKLFSMVKGPIEHVLAFPRLNEAYSNVAKMTDLRPFPDKVLEKLNVAYDLSDEDLAKIRIPSGPVIVVANHPFGGIEGVILASLLRSMRCDVKFMANYLLNSIPEMRELLIPVNPFKGKNSMRENIRPLRECIQWVKNGGMLVVFPAGEVSHFDIRRGAITDPSWNSGIARMIRKTQAPVLPVFFEGANSVFFQMAGMVHPLARTVMLPNELLNKNSRNITVRVGDLIPYAQMKSFEQNDKITEYLRLRTYLLELSHRKNPTSRMGMFPRILKYGHGDAIIPPQQRQVMAGEIRRLLPGNILLESGDHLVIKAEAEEIPHILLEIGRLREMTFRAAGEGTGKGVDLDRFDTSYSHLFIWNRMKQEVVGAYRIGKTDELVKHQGIRGIYTSTLFHYKPGFLDHLGPALEMGRSFVRLEYQKSYAPLLLLWKGIGRFIVENPHYRTLFGPVSITDDYQAASKQLIVAFLKANRLRTDLAGLVRPRKPLRRRSLRIVDIDRAAQIMQNDIDRVSDLISCIEKDRKGMPILLKHYLKLGGRIIGFNVDPAFGNALDGLITVDLTRTEPWLLERYMGKGGANQYLAYHQALTADRYATCA